MICFKSEIYGLEYEIFFTNSYEPFWHNPSLFGETEYSKLQIFIRENLCDDTKYQTLLHELTHALLNAQGRIFDNTFDREQICEFVAHNADYLVHIADDLWKKYKENNNE